MHVHACAYACEMRKYIHTAVGEGNCVCVAGHTLLLTVVGTGGRSQSVTTVDIARVDGLPTGRMPAEIKTTNTADTFIVLHCTYAVRETCPRDKGVSFSKQPSHSAPNQRITYLQNV